MAKYGKKAQKNVEESMHKMKHGELKSGRSGKTVKNRKQAIAIGLSEARKKGAKVPPSKKSKGQRGPVSKRKTTGRKKKSAAKSKR